MSKTELLFTLRGHSVGVSALDWWQVSGEQTLLASGDEEGNLIIWDVAIFKQVAKYVQATKSSRVQSVKKVDLIMGGQPKTAVLVVQFRDEGVQVLEFMDTITNEVLGAPKVRAQFPTFSPLFSRGDAKSTRDGRAVLAHPSLLENYLVTVRVLGHDACTEHSGTAGQEAPGEKNFPVFDIVLHESDGNGGYHLFVGHEDGSLNMYAFNLDSKRTVPVLNSEGLAISLVRRIDFNFKDFVAAFDVVRPDGGDHYMIVAGSPGRSLSFLRCPLELDREPELEITKLAACGVAAVSIGADKLSVAVGCWDKTVRLYSLKSRALLATMRQHTKQVQSVLFAARPASLLDQESIDPQNERQQSNSDTGLGCLLCCASQEGTISISSIY